MARNNDAALSMFLTWKAYDLIEIVERDGNEPFSVDRAHEIWGDGKWKHETTQRRLSKYCERSAKSIPILERAGYALSGDRYPQRLYQVTEAGFAMKALADLRMEKYMPPEEEV